MDVWSTKWIERNWAYIVKGYAPNCNLSQSHWEDLKAYPSLIAHYADYAATRFFRATELIANYLYGPIKLIPS